MRRRTAAILAQLNKVKPLPRTTAVVYGETLAKDREAVQASRGLALKTAGKVSTNERSFDMYVAQQGLQLDEESFPSEHIMVGFAAWLTRRGGALGGIRGAAARSECPQRQGGDVDRVRGIAGNDDACTQASARAACGACSGHRA